MNSRKQIPSNLDAERQVLGALMVDQGAIDRAVSMQLKTEDFYSPKHSAIYRACLELYKEQDSIDPTSLGNKLPHFSTQINEIQESVRSAKNVETHIKIVKQLSEKRNILDIAQRLVEMAHDKELPEVRTFAKEIVTKVLTNDDERKSLLSPADQVALLQRMLTAKREGEESGIKSGFPRLDSLTGGLRRGDLIVVGARTSVGKSSFAECIAENVATQGYPVLFVSVEMDPTQMAYRFAKRWGLSPAVLDYGSDDEASQRNLQEVVERRLDTPLYIWNAPGASTIGIRSHLNQMMSEVGSVDLVVVDYLQLLTDTFGGRVPEHLRLGMITKTLKQLAREYEIPVVLITQLNRNSDQRGVLPEPRLSDIRESGRIEEDADLILFLWKVKDPDILGNDTKMKIEKNRQGPLGEVPIRFHKPSFKFTEPNDTELQQLLFSKIKEIGEEVSSNASSNQSGQRSNTEADEDDEEDYDEFADEAWRSEAKESRGETGT